MNRELPLFAYGTLMFPQVIRTVIGHAPRGDLAMASGFDRLELIGHPFPGMVPAPDRPDATVEGVLYEGLSAVDWKELDDFEGPFYVLTEIAVTRAGESLRALTYIVAEERRNLLGDTLWDKNHFRTHHLDTFLTGS